MIGKYNIKIYNKYITYNFEIKRKYTIIRGNSASGKSYADYLVGENLRISSVKCDVPVISLSVNIEVWKDLLQRRNNSIIFIDEDFPYINSNDFINELLKSDNYFVIISRKNFDSIPYSYKEIYTLQSNKNFSNIETVLFPLYNDDFKVIKPDIIITEDSNSGFNFFKRLSEKYDFMCESAKGKNNIKKFLLDLDYLKNKTVLFIVDGSAFGSNIIDILNIINDFDNIYIYAPESFEFLILKAGAFKVSNNILEETYNYHDINIINKLCNTDKKKIIQSWEQTYTEILNGLSLSYTNNIAYTKSKLKEYYFKYTDDIIDILNKDGIILGR